jgi:hypothetical protein
MIAVSTYAVEQFAALAGESVDTDRDAGRGGALEYVSHAADESFTHMRDDQTMQAVLRFARVDSGATVIAGMSAPERTSPSSVRRKSSTLGATPPAGSLSGGANSANCSPPPPSPTLSTCLAGTSGVC